MLFLNVLLSTFFINLYLYVETPNYLKKSAHLASIGFLLLGLYLLGTLGYAISTSNLPFQACFLASATLLLLTALVTLQRKSTTRLNHAIAGFGVLAASLIAFAIINNYLFFRDEENSGLINPKTVEHGTPCPSNTLIYFHKQDNELVYRCATESSLGIPIAMGNMYNAPLIPWPNYLSGSSPKIARALHTRLEDEIILDKRHIINIEITH